jgi:hypothetical protein
MKKSKIIDRIWAIFAYDQGATDSGIKDDSFKAKLKKSENLEKYLTEVLREMLSRKEYGLADAKNFIDWIENELGYYL